MEMKGIRFTLLACLVSLAAAQFPAGPAAPGKFTFAPLRAPTAVAPLAPLAPLAHKLPVAPVYHAPALYHAPAHPEHAVPTSYHFEYAVNDEHTHDFKSQNEHKDEAHNVVGSYTLVEPDGSKRLVNYSSDEHGGFHAHVTKEGPYLHPDGAHSYHNFNLVQP